MARLTFHAVTTHVAVTIAILAVSTVGLEGSAAECQQATSVRPSQLANAENRGVAAEDREAETNQTQPIVLSAGRFGHVAGQSADGQILAAVVEREGRSEVEILDTVIRMVLTRLPLNPMSVTFSPDGELLAAAPRVGGSGSTVCDLTIWNVTTGEQTTSIRSAERISSLAFSPDGMMLACGIKQYFSKKTREAYGYGGVLLIDIATGAVHDRQLVPEPNHIVRHIAWSPDGTVIATAANRQVDIWSVRDQRLSHAESFDGTHRVCFSPDGRLLAWSHPVQEGDSFVGKVMVYDRHNESVRTIGQHDSTSDATILSLQFSPDGHNLLTAGFDGVIKVWDTTTDTMLHEIEVLKGGAVPYAGFGMDAETVLTIDGQGRLYLWQL